MFMPLVVVVITGVGLVVLIRNSGLAEPKTKRCAPRMTNRRDQQESTTGSEQGEFSAMLADVNEQFGSIFGSRK